MSKKLQVLDQLHFKKRLDQPTLVIFFGNEKKNDFKKKKIQLWDFNGALIP